MTRLLVPVLCLLLAAQGPLGTLPQCLVKQKEERYLGLHRRHRGIRHVGVVAVVTRSPFSWACARFCVDWCREVGVP